jgi:hypothetical protein
MMDETVGHIESTIGELINEIEVTLKQLNKTPNVDEKVKLANVIVQLSTAQKNMADTMDTLEDIDFINYDFDDDDDDEDFFFSEPLNLKGDNRIEFNPNSGGKKKKKNIKNKKDTLGNDEDLPF